jgi:hypothetical protein
VTAAKRPGAYDVRRHPEADREYRNIQDAKEKVAIEHAIEKLRVDGPALRHPHQSAVMGKGGEGLRELRPRQGRSRWRLIYRRVGTSLFVVLAIAPEAEVDAAGYRRRVRDAKKRLAELPEVED